MKRISRREALGGLLSATLGLLALVRLPGRSRPASAASPERAEARVTARPPQGSVRRHG